MKHWVIVLAWLASLLGFSSQLTQVSAAEHPLLVVTAANKPALLAKQQALPAVADAVQRMSSQSWYAGGAAWAQEEAWSRQLVELSFVGFLTSDATKTSQAKSILLDRSAGPNRYGFDVFDDDARKYGYGQPCAALAVGYDLLQPSLSSQENAQVQGLLAEWGSGLYEFYQNNAGSAAHNFHTSSVACMGLIGLVLEDSTTSASTWQSWAAQEFRSSFVNTAYNPGGDYTEGYVYQQYGLPVAVLFLDALQKNKGVDLVANANLSQLWNFYLAAYGSDGLFPRYGNNTEAPFIVGTDLYLLQKATNQQRIPEYLWLWQQLRGTGAAQNRPAADLTYLFRDFDHLAMVLYYPNATPQAPTRSTIWPSQLLTSKTTGTTQGLSDVPGGMAVLRSEWPTNSQSTALWLNNRWRWQNHQHYDPNAFTLEGYGETLISNLNNRAYSDPLKGKWSQQNTVRIDPDRYGGDAPISNSTVGSAAALGTFPHFFTSQQADVLVSDSRYSHANLHLHGLPDGRFSLATPDNIAPIAQAERTVVLVRDMLPKPFFLTFDDFRKDGASEYLWQVYIPNRASNLTGVGSMNQPFRYSVDQAKLSLAVLNQPQASMAVGDQQADRADRPLRMRLATPQLQLLMALFPDQATGANPQFRQLQTNPLVYEITYDGQSVQVVFNPSGEAIVYNDIETDAVLAVGKNWLSTQRSIVFHGATHARLGGVDWFRSPQRQTQVIAGDQGLCAPTSDLNSDEAVNLLDLSLLLTQISQASADPAYDLNCDDVVSVADLSVLFGQLAW